jgi:ABC-type sugar transport system substrate-binding protein
MNNLTVDTLDNGAAVVNVGTDGGYVMVEYVKAGWIQITVFNDEGDVLMEREFDTLAHDPDVKLREV